MDKKRHSDKMIELLRFYAEKGRSLHGDDSVCVPLRRSPLTVMKYCRQGGIELADYRPRKPRAVKNNDEHVHEVS